MAPCRCSRSACRRGLPSNRSSAFKGARIRSAPGYAGGDIDQRQTTTVDQRFHRAQQHASASGMDRLKCIAQSLLQYFSRAHGVVSSGFVTREE